MSFFTELRIAVIPEPRASAQAVRLSYQTSSKHTRCLVFQFAPNPTLSMGNLPTLAQLETPMGKLWGQAVSRLVSQTIQNPRRADKQQASLSPVGRLTFGLFSFISAFYNNIHRATYERTARNYSIGRDAGMSKGAATWLAGSKTFVSFGLGMTALVTAQMLLGVSRSWTFDGEEWDKHVKADDV